MVPRSAWRDSDRRVAVDADCGVFPTGTSSTSITRTVVVS